jgi:uncharacterized transporter YbjL
MTKGTRFIRVYGFVLIGLFVGCVYAIYVISQVQDRPLNSSKLGYVISLWYFITGIGLLARRPWGYYLFKCFLYVLLLAFPIGTIVSYKSLSYIKRHSIKSLFYDPGVEKEEKTR